MRGFLRRPLDDLGERAREVRGVDDLGRPVGGGLVGGMVQDEDRRGEGMLEGMRKEEKGDTIRRRRRVPLVFPFLVPVRSSPACKDLHSDDTDSRPQR